MPVRKYSYRHKKAFFSLEESFLVLVLPSAGPAGEVQIAYMVMRSLRMSSLTKSP